MASIVTIWTIADCPRCNKIKNGLRGMGFQTIERSADIAEIANESPYMRDTVMADLQLRDGAVPLVYAGDKLLDTGTVEALLDAHR